VQSPDILQVIANPDPVAAPAGPPAANPGVSAVLRVGRPVTCNAPSLPGASATQYFWYRHTQAAGYTRIGRGRTITLTGSTLGARIQCDVRYEGAGGFVYKETPLGAYVGPVRPRPTTLHVYGPPHPLVGKNYAVGANGWTAKRRVLQVTIHRHGQCKPTYGADQRSGSFVVFARFVGPGDYNQTRGKLHFTQRTQGHYCAYLGNPNDLQSHPPVARASQQFAVGGG
jgi:hypothetical protein